MKHLDLFSGIGGFALAARRVGWETTQFVENDPWCARVLQKNFPGVPVHDDVQTYTAAAGSADVITAGFPCQDISLAGKGAGLDGERSGLWSETCRTISLVRPKYAVLENVAALLARGLDRVAGELAEIGYDCEWHCIPASAVGAPHRRDRIWIIAYPSGTGLRPQQERLAQRKGATKPRHNGKTEPVADAEELAQRPGLRSSKPKGKRRRRSGNGCGPLADPTSIGPSRSREPLEPGNPATSRYGQAIKSLDGCFAEQWATEPDVGRVAYGVPRRVDRLRGLGNAIVPAVAEVIFRAINESRE